MLATSLQTRIVALFLTLIVIVVAGGLLAIDSVGVSSARKSIGEDLVAGERLFDRVREQERARLTQAARLLSADAPFRQAVAVRDSRMLATVLERYGREIGAELMMLVRDDDVVIADTLGLGTDDKFYFPKLLKQARSSGRVSALVVVQGRLYQLIVVPVNVAGPFAWVAVGYSVDDDLAREISRLVRLDVSFVTRPHNGNWKLQGSSLVGEQRSAMLRHLTQGQFDTADDNGNAIDSSDAVTRIKMVRAHTDDAVAVVLQQPLSVALEPFRRLQRQLGWIALAAAIVAVIASAVVARGIARPLRKMAKFARNMAAGDYSAAPPVSSADEIGDLAEAFRSMQAGLASREQRITNLAYRDTLTGLPNRTKYSERLDRALETSAGTRTPVAVLLMDIDHFKYVNDTLGHAVGDQLLLEAAARVRSVVTREGDTVARLGGDEFALLLPEHSAQDALRVASAILRALEAPMSVDGRDIDVRASIGIAASPEHGVERSTLMSRADIAMYAAKRSNAGVLVWDDRYDQHSRDRLALMSDLRRAVDNGELVLFYQPQVALRHAGEHHAEALVRWRHPARGLVPPSDFIPFAEQTGYIRAITDWVMNESFAQCARWRASGLPMNVSINISARDLMDVGLPERFAQLLQAHGCQARWIALEITESAILDDPDRAIENLSRLRALGCRLAIDDYGTGYSSLAYLRRLPVDEVKIDKSFVMNLASDASDAMIVRSTIDLAHNMGLVVVAEGVDDEAVLERLRSLGCDMVQGYLLSWPITAHELEARLRVADVRESREAPATTGLRRVV